MENHVSIKAEFVPAYCSSEFQDQVDYYTQANHYAHSNM